DDVLLGGSCVVDAEDEEPRAVEGDRHVRVLGEDGPARVLQPEGPLVSDGHERLWDERDEQDDDGDDADDYPPRVEPADGVRRRRMPDAELEAQVAEDEAVRVGGGKGEEV